MAAAARYTSEMYNDIQKLTNVKKGVKNKSPVFYPLKGLSQSEQDRFMNYRTVRPPKNIDLIEGDDAGVASHIPRTMDNFPSEHSLSSKIKEVNGMDHSNYSIEQHFQSSQSASLELSEDSTCTSSSINESSQYSESQKDTSGSHISNMPEAESFCAENDLPANSNDTNSAEYKADNHQTDEGTDTNTIDVTKCRYSKNAAIMGLLRNKLIPPEALTSDSQKDDHNIYPETTSPKIEPSTSSSSKEEAIGSETGKSDSKDFNYESKKIADYPQLVPHPNVEDLFTHPIQAYGKLKDAQIDYTLPRKGTKNTTTPRQRLIRDSLNAETFQFKKPAATSKPKSNISFPSMVSRSANSSLDDSQASSAQSDSFNPFINENSGTFSMNDDEFPDLGK